MVKPDHVDGIVAKWKQECPQYNLAPVEIIGRAGRIMEYVDRALEVKFEEFGISRPSFDVLATLRRNGPPYKMAQRDLMQNLLRTSGSMSLRIDALERNALVKREQDVDDRRSVFVVLSKKGSQLLDAVIPEHLANESNLIAGLSTTERAELVGLLRKWLASLEISLAERRQLYLGLTVLPPQTSLLKRRAVGLPDVPGLLIHSVEPGSTAEEAGFRKGDLICEIQDRPVLTLVELRKVLNRDKPRVKRFRVFRGVNPVSIRFTTRMVNFS
jgi:DNA-binding MarR family transcriptional regulator